MALNLSTLTSPATSGDVLQEVLTTADFLEPCPVLRNLSRGSNKGGDAKQDVALNQPKALPLDANGKGYCYLPVTTGNAPAVTFPTIGASDDFVLEMDVYLVSGTNLHFLSGANADHKLAIYNGYFFIGGFLVPLSSPLALGVSNIKIERTSGTITLKQNDAVIASMASSSALTFTHLSFNGQFVTSVIPLNGYIQKTTLSVGGTEELNIDFTATNVRHGDTKFKCATGQVVTINKSGNDPATVIKKSVLRFDGVNDALRGVFANNIDGGYMFAAFSVLGNGGLGSGSGADARLFSVNATADLDYSPSGFVYGLKYGNNNDLAAYGASAYLWAHNDMYDDDRGDILYETKAKSGGLITKVNNANKFQPSTSLAIASNEFNVGNGNLSLSRPAAFDLEFLAVFPASITDAQADDVRNYINNRNNVFDLKDGFGYYFYDATKAPVGAITTGSSSWNGRIVGSDNGDSDRYLTQGTTNDAPVGDGYVVTFADNTDHLEWTGGGIAGVMVVGTSIGTFSYRVRSGPTTRQISLLGNVTTVNGESYKQNGSLYGLILLPTEATTKDVQEARQFLIDRGASAGSVGTNITSHFRERTDIVVFDNADFSGVTVADVAWRFADAMTAFNVGSMPDLTNAYRTWSYCSALESFNTLLPAVTDAREAWYNCSSLSSFGTTEISNCTDFSNAWKGTAALTSFPADALLGTSAQSVNFTSAWQSSGLLSFPADIDLSKGTTFSNTWRQSGLTSFPDIQSTQNGTTFLNAWYNCASMTSFGNANLDKGGMFQSAWQACYNLEDFPALFTNWNPSSITTGVFNVAWDACNKLTAQSVENILTSIDASGQYATSTGASGGSALADAGIDIDYNVATGSLSAATNSAVTSLKAKGWSIIVNNVTL